MLQGDPSDVVAISACREMPAPTLHKQAASRLASSKGGEMQLERTVTILESTPLALVEVSRNQYDRVNVSRKWHEGVEDNPSKMRE